MRASVWRMGRTTEDRLMYSRSIKAATSRNGFISRIEKKRTDLQFLFFQAQSGSDRSDHLDVSIINPIIIVKEH